MPETKPIAQWRLNLFHLIIIFISYLAPILGGLPFFYDYIQLTLPLYLILTLVMLLPKISFSIRIVLSVVGIIGYALLRAKIIFQHTTSTIAAGEEASMLLLHVLSPMMFYLFFIWVGYPSFKKISIIKKILLLIGVMLSHVPIAIVIFMVISTFLGALNYLSEFFL